MLHRSCHSTFSTPHLCRSKLPKCKRTEVIVQEVSYSPWCLSIGSDSICPKPLTFVGKYNDQPPNMWKLSCICWVPPGRADCLCHHVQVQQFLQQSHTGESSLSDRLNLTELWHQRSQDLIATENHLYHRKMLMLYYNVWRKRWDSSYICSMIN